MPFLVQASTSFVLPASSESVVSFHVTSLCRFWNDPVDFVRLGGVQLGSVRQLIKVVALVEGTAKSGFPRGVIWLVHAFFIFPLEQSPRLEHSPNKPVSSFLHTKHTQNVGGEQ